MLTEQQKWIAADFQAFVEVEKFSRSSPLTLSMDMPISSLPKVRKLVSRFIGAPLKVILVLIENKNVPSVLKKDCRSNLLNPNFNYKLHSVLLCWPIFESFWRVKINLCVVPSTSVETSQLCRSTGRWAPACFPFRWRRDVCAPAANRCGRRRSRGGHCEDRRPSPNICDEPCGLEPIQRCRSVVLKYRQWSNNTASVEGVPVIIVVFSTSNAMELATARKILRGNEAL